MSKRGLGHAAVMLGVLVFSSQVFAQGRELVATDRKNQPYRLSSAVGSEKLDTPPVAHISREVRQKLTALPYYSLFDWLQYEVRSDSTVLLRGQVVQPVTKSDAGGRVKNIDGVAGVENQIEVLPLSPNDERLRIALHRAIYGFGSPLFRYGTRMVPSIHLIVKNGRATLKGVVATRGDSNLAFMRARSVPGLFEVKNELDVENARPR